MSQNCSHLSTPIKASVINLLTPAGPLVDFPNKECYLERMNNDTWVLIEIAVPAPAVDLVCAELADLGCAGTLVEKRDLDTFTVPNEDLDPALDLCLQAYFPGAIETEELSRRIEQVLEMLRPLFKGRTFALGEQRQVHQEDWADGWKQHFSLFKVGQRLIIKPSWEDYQPTAEERVLELDPGMAFGTGTHGTTLLCLKAIVALMEESHPPQSLLDVGTGSGILAMAAAALGAQRVLACDIDPVACEVATENCRLNGLADSIEITTCPLEQLPGTYDVVVANILAEENLRLADHLLSHLNPGGYLFLSGILAEKESMVRAGFADQPLSFLGTARQDEWVCLSWRRN